MVLEQKGIKKIFFLFLHEKTYVVDTHKKHLTKALLMHT